MRPFRKYGSTTELVVNEINAHLSRRKERGKSKLQGLAIFGVIDLPSLRLNKTAQSHQQGLMDASRCYPPQAGVEVRLLNQQHFG